MTGDSTKTAAPLSRRRAILYGLVVVATIFLVLELLARGIWAFAFPAQDPVAPTAIGDNADYDRDIPYRFQPNEIGQIASTFVRTNNLGFRGTQPTLRKEPGQFRIVCVGDSVTFGYNATTNREAYPAVLQRLFGEHSEKVEVINAGMPGFESRHVAAFVEQVILGIDGNEKTHSLDPDLLLVECGWNDARRFAPAPERRRPTLWNRIAGTIYLVRLPVQFLVAARTGDPEWEQRAAWNLIEKVREGPPQHNPEAERVYRQSFETMVDLCRANNVKVAIIAPPNFLETDLDDAAWLKCASHFAKYPTLSFEGWQIMVRSMIEANREVAAEQAVAFIDTTPLSDATLFADICHLNDEGNERLAKLVYRELLQRDLVPPAEAEP